MEPTEISLAVSTVGQVEGTYPYKLELVPATVEWVKKRSNKPSDSANQGDDLVWCLVEKPAKTETYYLIKDTSANPNYEWKTISTLKIVKEGGYTEWREVLCDSQVKSSLIRKVALSLTQNGYPVSENDIDNRTMGDKMKSALVKYQKEHYLPIGNLNFETLNALGVIETKSPSKKRRKKKRAKKRSS